MVSELKRRVQALRSGRGVASPPLAPAPVPAPPPAPDGLATPAPPAAKGVQTLELEGHAELDLGPGAIEGVSPLLEGMTFHVGAWVSSDAFASGRRDGEGRFRLRLPVDARTGTLVLKLQLYVEMVDPETQLCKPFPLGTGLACLRELSAQAPVTVACCDPFSEQQVCLLTLRAASRIDVSGLRASALHDTGRFNRVLEALSADIVRSIREGNVRVPEVARGFVDGLSCMPAAGSARLGIPPLKTHYAALSRLIAGVDRPLPHALLLYYLQTVLTHAGLTIDEANGLANREFARVAGDVAMGITFDADQCPYQRDLALMMGIVIDPELHVSLGLNPVTSEDIGLPFAQHTFIGRDMTPQARPELRAVLAGGSDSPRARLARCVGLLHGREWPPLCRAAVQDDCETSATAGLLAVSTVRAQDMSAAAFRRGAKGHAAFQAWTPACYEAAGRFFGRMQAMLRSGSLTVDATVGLAGGAAANARTTDEGGAPEAPGIDERGGLGGHCFAVMRYRDPDGGADGLYVRILEGTSCMRTYHERPGCPRYRVRMNMDGQESLQELPMSRFLTLLSNTVSMEAQVVNRVIGGGGDKETVRAGVRGARDIPGFVRPTIVMRCLHSLDPGSRAGSEVAFYKWCLFTGMTEDGADVGTLPLDELEYPGPSGQRGAGCRPACLATQRLQGVASALREEDLSLGVAILNEAWPPLADAATFRGLLNLWEPLEPLSRANAGLGELRRKGVPYTSVACMESPASHALVDVVYEAKRLLVDEVNAVNLVRPDSDGIFLTAAKIGTGVAVVVHVPEAQTAREGPTLTLVASIKEAKANLGWPEAPA